MKLVNSKDQINNKKNYNSIILENSEDVEVYKSFNELIKTKQAINFWIGFKSQKFHPSPTSYAQHEVESGNSMARLMATTLEYSNGMSLVEYCNKADDFIIDMHRSMFNFINKQKFVSINDKGGYCEINNNLKDYEIIQDIDSNQLKNFLLHGEIDVDFKINSHSIAIENANYKPTNIVEKYNKLTSTTFDSVQILTGFKLKTILFNKVDWFNFFDSGVKEHNLKNIMFETTAQDMRQIKELAEVLEHVIKTPNKINVYIKTNKQDVIKELDYNKDKINIIFL